MAMDPTESAAPKQEERVRLPKNLFPLEYGKAFSQWWSGMTPAAAEASVLQFIPFYSSSLKPAMGAEASKADHTTPPLESSDDRVCASSEVRLSDPKNFLNEFSVTRPTAASADPHNLVILHGYGAGLGFFYKNFDALSRRSGWSMYALDLLGMGRSSRPHFKIHATDRIGKVREAESFFVDSLEDWRKARGLEKFTLMGHSLGGYLAVCYALKYPNRLQKLILVSPVGIPVDPHAWRGTHRSNACIHSTADNFLNNPSYAPPTAADFSPHALHPVRVVRYEFATLWDPSNPSKYGYASANRSRAAPRAGDSDGNRVPKNLRDRLKRSKGAVDLLHSLEEEVRRYAVSLWGCTDEHSVHSAPTTAATPLADAESSVVEEEMKDSEDEDIVFIPRMRTVQAVPGDAATGKAKGNGQELGLHIPVLSPPLEKSVFEAPPDDQRASFG
ncbi:hypothetical protein DRE_07712 [Drechslerella stenobrocha 248]|uniref:AB hydrolase-1 domain-containing protein n=1 Tax=Drechslerella stenobrocha 248 TaxID=1043628 RepID=W7I3T8_9PEZI|nr:hypothetical protein DRE_07712 [Drechslerella stenobrocha 248]